MTIQEEVELEVVRRTLAVEDRTEPDDIYDIYLVWSDFAAVLVRNSYGDWIVIIAMGPAERKHHGYVKDGDAAPTKAQMIRWAAEYDVDLRRGVAFLAPV